MNGNKKHLSAVVAVLVGATVWGAGDTAPSPWFLPYAPDPDTLVLAHCDGGPIQGAPGTRLETVAAPAACPGRFGRGFRLAAGKQCLKLVGGEALKFRQNDPFTIEMWVRPADARGGALWSCATRFYLHIGNRRRFGYRAASFPIRYLPIDGLQFKPGKWVHVALTHAPNRTVRVYGNGRKIAELQHSAEGDYAKSRPVLVVGSHDGWTGFLRADVDEIRVSKCVRTFRPLFEPLNLLKGEAARLTAPADSLPANIARIRVTVRANRKTVFHRETARKDIGNDLIPAAALPPDVLCVAEVEFLDSGGQVVGTARTPIENAARRMFRAKQLIKQLEGALASAGVPELAVARETVRVYLSDLRRLLANRDLEHVDALSGAARNALSRLTDGTAAYASALHRLARLRPLPSDTRISMSWNHDPEGAFPWARRLGANELIASGAPDPERLRTWKDAGYRTVWLQGLPIHDGTWLKPHPENRQRGYWVSKWTAAATGSTSIPFKLPGWGGATYVLDRQNPARDWKVVDDRGQIVPARNWTMDPKRPVVTLHKASPDRRYRVFYTFRAQGLLDPLSAGAQERATGHLRETLAPLRDVLDTYWFDDIAYAYPGPNEHSRWEWESYALTAGPNQVAAFEAETGIPFNPEWLVLLPRFLDAVPDERCLTWMNWVRDRLKPFIAANAAVVREAGMRSWLYWGDCHVGMEPYAGSAGQVDALDKPSGDPVTLRALTDFPGKTIRRMRVDWLFARSGEDPAIPGRFRRKWRDIRPALLCKPYVKGLYWMVFDNIAFSPAAAVRTDMVETITDISDEFRTIVATVGGTEPFRHNLTVTILSAWGANYAWRPWGSSVLRPFTALPVRIRFASFREVATQGVPSGTDVVYLFGQPGTAWSGGHWWADGRVARALSRFVTAGGGLIAAQAPSAGASGWALTPLLGVAPVPVPQQKTDTKKVGLEPMRLTPSSSARSDWLFQDAGEDALGFEPTDAVRVRVVAADAVTTAWWRDAATQKLPGLVLRQSGQGRALYACAPLHGNLLYRSLLWATRREQDVSRLAATPAGVTVFAYPSRRILAVNNGVGPRPVAVKVTVRCDPAIFGVHDADNLTLEDLVRQQLRSFTGKQFRDGIVLDLPPAAFELFRVRVR